MDTSVPRVSVALPVYRTKEKYLRDCLDGLLAQTETNFEIVILDDCPEDTSAEKVIREYMEKDPRIIYQRNSSNLGISETRNRLIDMCRAEYIAVHDHDDISLPNRLEKEADYLDAHPDTAAVGSWMKSIGGCPRLEKEADYLDAHPDTAAVGSWMKSIGGCPRLEKFPDDDSSILRECFYRCPVGHTTAMLRKSMLKKHGIRYEEEFFPCEDFALFIKIALCENVHNIPETLVIYRDHDDNTSSTHMRELHLETDRLRAYLAQKRPDVAADAYAFGVKQWKITIFGIPVLKVRQYVSRTVGLLFGFLPVFRCQKSLKKGDKKYSRQFRL